MPSLSQFEMDTTESQPRSIFWCMQCNKPFHKRELCTPRCPTSPSHTLQGQILILFLWGSRVHSEEARLLLSFSKVWAFHPSSILCLLRQWESGL